MNKRLIGIVFILLISATIIFIKDTSKESSTEVAMNQPKVASETSHEPVDVTEPQETSIESVEVVELAVDKPAPDFTLYSLEGDEVALSDYKGKTVLINFWATWCTFCDKEMPDLEKLNNEYEDVVVLAVNVRENQELVNEYIDKGGYSFPVVLDIEGVIASKFLITAFPTSYFVDKEGILLGAVPGMMTYDQMESVINQIVEE